MIEVRRPPTAHSTEPTNVVPPTAGFQVERPRFPKRGLSHLRTDSQLLTHQPAQLFVPCTR